MIAEQYLPAVRRFCMGLLLAGVCASAQAQVWNLESSIEQATAVAPELRAAEAEVSARAGERTQAGAWPNPTVELRGDEKLGIEDGRGGYNLNQISVTQPLPLRRLAHQRRAAEAGLDAARATQQQQRLQLEKRTAQAFHALQLAAERQRLAQERLDFAEGVRPGSDRLVRYLSPLERARLDILRETARQDVGFAEGKWSEAASQFRALLALPPESRPETAALTAFATPAALTELQGRLATHPALRASQHARDASRAQVNVARSQRFADPSVSVFRERDYLAGSRQDYSGVMLGVQIPFWNANGGGVARAVAEADKADALLAAQRRDLESGLRQNHLHLGHLIEQAEHYRTRLLTPARQVLDLTRNGFASGEQNGLALVDASNTYFEAQARYLELLHDAWVEAAELRLAAGLALAGDKAVQP